MSGILMVCKIILNYLFCFEGELRDEDLVADNVVVEVDDFTKSFSKFIPSISRQDLEYFNKLKSSYSI